MERKNVVRDKSFKFALRIIKLHKFLYEEKREFVICKQLLRSGTSIGANIEEAIGGRTKRDFLNKIYIAYKEARETKYWLKLLKESSIVNENLLNSFLEDCEELLKLTGKIITTGKASLEKKRD